MEANRESPGGTMAEADGVRSDLAVKPYYLSEDIVAREMNAGKKIDGRQGREQEQDN